MAVADPREPAEQTAIASERGERLRPARALLGWAPDELAYSYLNSKRDGAVATEAQRARVLAARAAVAARPEGVDQSELVSPLPDELAEYAADLRVAAADLYDAGWELRIVDLARVCAFQPVVHADRSVDRAPGVRAGDLQSVAAVTVPLASDARPRVSFNEGKNAWVMASPNTNLRVIGHFSLPVESAPKGAHGFGFLMGVTPSRLTVAEFGGRHYLRDGYHRSLALLMAGVRTVPAFVRSLPSIERLVPRGMLPQAAYTGPRPPTLSDYLQDDVSADVWLPASEKVAMVLGVEIDFLT